MAQPKLFCAVLIGSITLSACAKKGDGPDAENAYTASNDPMIAAPVDPMASSEPTTSGADTSFQEPGPVATTDAAGMPLTQPAGTTGDAQTVPLTDGQIVKVTETVHAREIEQAKAVQQKAKNPEVKKLAAEIIKHHEKLKKQDASIAKKAELTPEDSPVSNEINQSSQQALESIKTAAAPAEAERAYVDAQVRQHESALELLNQRLIPNAINQDLKAQLEETRGMLEKHMEKARKVQQAMTESAAQGSAG